MLKSLVTAFAVVSFAIAALSASAETAYSQKVQRNSPADRFVVSFDKSYGPGQIIVSFSDRRLYHVTKRGEAVSYPITVPRPQSRWEGVNRISMKRKNPTWTPTASMLAENPSLPKQVAGGDPRNPLGKRALYLGSTLYRIHGTDAPWTIGRNVSKGCVRMHNAHVGELFNKVKVGTRVTVTYKKFRTAAIGPVRPVYTYAAAKQAPRVVRKKVNGKTVRVVRQRPLAQPNLLVWLLGS